MVDFHSHILPDMDDGAEDVETSLAMLRESRRQGVDLICSTSHFYADEEDPDSFLSRRDAAFRELLSAMEGAEDYPRILLGAEVLYFPGISGADEIRPLRLSGCPFLLIEPPMMPWTNAMIDEIELCGETLNCIPVIAHIDRYMRILNDNTLFERLENRRILIQVNTSFFMHRASRELALKKLREKRIHFLGTDCHNLSWRSPNMGEAAQIIREAGEGEALDILNQRLYRVFSKIS